ncbi:major facilitator superfamily domain-containing protein [Pisolithus orientalis]|uniref:major facilitator superfamily domain-containing protein n=1 Tax=Pisolithus orientalis TaxID=936130 RepID=UPI002224B863|nr:major facilitator superfamily domain-containing protein [Pisolithus orientalis]KAI6032653.1 major facilitator superfamily domain-containing protein [Pisolithus orientalis]
MSQFLSCVLPSEHDPRQWSERKRWMIALIIWNLIAPIDMAITFYSGVQGQIQDQFGTSNTIATLGVGLYNLGGVFGVLFGGPLSELYGRRPIYVVSSICFAVFSLGATLSPNISTLLVCRGLMGLLGSPVFSIYGGSVADLFMPEERGPVVALFTLVLQGAPTIGPVPSSFLGPFLPWRWLLGFITIWGGVVGAATILFVPETEPKAIRRKIAKAEGMVPDVKEIKSSKAKVWSKALLTPITMLRNEPIIIWTTLYHSFVYGLLFLLLEAFPHIYDSHYSMSREQAGLVFIAPFIGNVLGVLIYFGYYKPQYEARQRVIQIESGGKSEIEPEARLPGVILASLVIPLGLFWLTFSAHPDIHYFFPIVSGVPIGMGMTLLQLSLFNYYIDLYPTMSASAIAANSAVRGLVATVLPSVGLPLYTSLGIRNANVLLACVSCIGLPTSIILYVFGRRLRATSRWAKQAMDVGSLPHESTGAVAPLLAQSPQTHYGGTSSSE